MLLIVRFLIVIFVALPPNRIVSTNKGANIGTVLFAPSDANKDCWSAENLALLTARMVLEGILPERDSLNVNDEQMVNDVIEYFRLILEVVRKTTTGKIKHIMLLALTDTLGKEGRRPNAIFLLLRSYRWIHEALLLTAS